MSFFSSDAFQTLTAAFSFGILLQAATGGAFIVFKGHGSTLLQDGGRRLALLLFMVFAVLWAQVAFGTLLVTRRASNVCQGVLIFSMVADQFARVALEQFLLWSIARGTRISPVAFVMQGVLLLRLVAGGILVGFSRPSFEPTCVAQTTLLPSSIVVLCLDLIIIGFLIIRAMSLGMFKDLRDKQSSSKKQQSKAFILTVAGFLVWTATSVVMLLGLRGFMLALRTSVPANGLLILVGMVTIFSETLLSTKEHLKTTPEAQSPFVGGPETTTRDLPGGMVASGSPRSGNRLTMNGRLFVVNETPQDSPNRQTGQQRDNRGFRRLSDDAPPFGTSDQGQFTSSGHGPGYRGSSGIFGAMAAPMMSRSQVTRNSSTIPPSSNGTREVAASTKSLFAWVSKPTAKTPIRALGISQPILIADDSDEMPFSRIPTTDLATAAKNERERREATTFANSHPLVSNPVTPQQYLSPIPGPSRSAGMMRERIPYLPDERLPTVRGSTSTSLLPMGAGSTTSASVSPGRDEVRRRSPRQLNLFDMKLDEKPMAPPKLQRNNTIGLPMNPRSQKSAMTATSKEIEVEDTTIMRMNNIVYENPGAVKSIIRNAESSLEALQRPKTVDYFLSYLITPLKSTDSIIHRPRPYSKKNFEIDRALFPIEPSSGHRRTKSAGSVLTSRSSVFSSYTSNATVPSLPPMPRSAAELKKLFPKGTKVMSFDEQIQLLFPAPPRSSFLPHRRSSVPSVPRVPSMFMPDTPHTRSPTMDGRQSSRTSKRTTIASFAPLANTSFAASSSKQQGVSYDISLPVEDSSYEELKSDNGTTPITLNPSSISSSPINYKHSFPAATKFGPTFEVDNLKLVKRTSTVGSMASLGSHQDDASTDWASIHSRIPPPIDLRQARKNARSTFIRGIVHDDDQKYIFESLQSPSGALSNGETDIIPVMLDDGKTDYSSYANSISSVRSGTRYENASVDWDSMNSREPIADMRLARKNARSSFIRGIVHDHDQDFTFKALASPTGNESDDEIDLALFPTQEAVPTWHFRIGDQLPTFSERKTRFRARKMPAPAPLPLHRMNKRPTNIMVHLAEPSPVESPERAIGLLKAQLDRFEGPDLESRNAISEEGSIRQLQIQDRLKLLETLEREMDEQEDHRQNLSIDRNSVFTIMSNTPSNVDSARDASRRGSKRVSYFSTRNDDNRILQPAGDESTFTTSSRSSINSRSSIWLARLAEAQQAYRENAPTLLRKSLNFLAMPSMQVVSPTPPESLDSGNDIEIELGPESDSDIEYSYFTPPVLSKAPIAKLWEYAAPSPQAAMGRLWSYPYETLLPALTPEPPAKNLRPLQRINVRSLQLSSTSLWTKPSLSTNPRLVSGLWRSNLIRPKSIVTKRASVRPNRKTRRMTILPDIVESPVPVPNKAEKLGIFQFPWGETSDQPIYQPAFVAAPYSNFIPNPRLSARSMQLEPEISEYSSSFFDDYDDENEFDIQDSEEDSEYTDSEDELYNGEEQFGDNTLIEIADLLQSNDVPSRQSLFSPVDIVGDYADAIDAESSSEADEPSMKFLQAPVRFPIPPLSYSPKPRSPFANIAAQEDMYFGIKSTSEDEFEDGVAFEMEPSILFDHLSQDGFDDDSSISDMESASESEDDIFIEMESAVQTDTVSREESEDELVIEIEPSVSNDGLWTAQEPKLDLLYAGLFSCERRTLTTLRGTDQALQPMSFARTPRNATVSLPQLLSKDLWSSNDAIIEDKVWISTSLVNNAPAALPTQSMWALPSPEMVAPVKDGLFTIPVQKASFGAINVEPASTGAVYKPRVHVSLLAVLGSKTLWNGSRDLPSEHHWISESSVSPPSPSVYSPSPLTGITSLSGRSSYDLFDTASIRTTSTKASSLWASMSTSTPTWREPQFMKKPSSPALSIPDFRRSALSPSDALAAREVEQHFRIPKLRRQKSRENFQKSHDKNEAAPRDLKIEEESNDETSKKAIGMEFMSIRGSLRPSARRPIKKVKPAYVRIQSTKADWDAALSEAVAAGNIKLVRPTVNKDDWIAELNKKATIVGPVNPKKERPTVSEMEWVAALNEAVLAGALHKPKRPTVSKDDWIAELNSKAVIIGPAYAKKVRPVSTEADWDAALEEAIAKSMVVVKFVKTLWSSPSEVTIQSESKLWSQVLVRKVEATQASEISIPNTRRVLPAENPDFSILESTELWNITQTSSKQVDWISLQRSNLVPVLASVAPMTWRARNTAPVTLTLADALWSAPIDSSLESPASLFSHMEVLPAKRSTPTGFATIEKLTSSTLWESTSLVSAQANWILSQISKPVAVASSPSPATWTLRKSPIPSPLTTNGLWLAPNDTFQSPICLFSRIISTSAKRTRKSTPIGFTALEQLTSNTLWNSRPPVLAEVHWILSQVTEPVSVTAPPPLATWRPRISSAPSPLTKTALWERPNGYLQSPTLFTHIEFTPTKKSTPSRLANLPLLNSSELYTPIPDVEKPLRIHWLLRSASFPLIRPVVKAQPTGPKVQRSSIWSAPVPNSSFDETTSSLWIARSDFSNEDGESIPGFNTINEPWTRKQRSMTTTITSFQPQDVNLWTSNQQESRSPKNWLLATIE